MKIKFTLACKKCGCKMDLDSECCVARESILCQNCGQPVPDWAYDGIVSAIADSKAIPDWTDGEEGNGFYISAKIIPPYYTNPAWED